MGMIVYVYCETRENAKTEPFNETLMYMYIIHCHLRENHCLENELGNCGVNERVLAVKSASSRVRGYVANALILPVVFEYCEWYDDISD
jgi:hypothetical protein